jgi:two-component system, chemotaxis family, sensor kinase CheA
MTVSLDRAEFIAGYLAEAEEHVRSANANLLLIERALKADEPHQRQVRELFRSLHTLKGLSAMVGIEPIVDLAHEMESVLRAADRLTGKLSAPSVEVLLQGVAAIEQRVSAVAHKKPVRPAPQSLLEALADLQTGVTAPSAQPSSDLGLDPDLLQKLSPVERDQLADGLGRGRRALHIDVYPSPERAAQGHSITAVRERVSALAEIVKVVPRSVPRSERAPGGLAFSLIVLTSAGDAELCAAAAADIADLHALALPAASADPDLDLPSDLEADLAADVPLITGHIRVDIARLDEAIDGLGALVVTRFRLARAVAQLRERGVDVRELNSILNDNHRQLRDLRTSITRARMISVAELLERVPLIVRGMNRSTGKQVGLRIDAGRGELDKAVAERIFPAIVHLVRNAVDHAIETPEARRRLGKPEQGSITVACFEHSDTQLELSVRDDGRGIDAAALATRAGRPAPQNVRELLELVTLAGLSTRDQITSESGRGIGMEIVKRIAVDELGGQLAVESTPDAGTTFTLRVPMSISILDSFSLECGSQRFVVPVAAVEEIIEIEPARVSRAPAPHSTRFETRLLERRGEIIPLVALGELFELDLRATPGETSAKALIVRRQGEPFAFAVDRMLGQQEVVVRPMEDPLVRVLGVAGTTDLGSGQPTLVIDLLALSARVASSAREFAA